MKILLLLLLLFPLLAGCATIVHGTTQKIPVTSEPLQANVNVDGIGNYPTPVTLELKRNMDHLLTITKEGFMTEVITIIHTLSGAVAGNIIAGGLIGWGVDAISGGQYKLIPETVHVVLKPEGYAEKPSEEMQIGTYRNFERDKVRLEYEKLNLEREKMGLSPVELPEHLKEPSPIETEKTSVETPNVSIERTTIETPLVSQQTQEMPVVKVGQKQSKNIDNVDKRAEERRKMNSRRSR